ncbi:MAG: glutathione S-transferase C-terminal domain-containing protein [Alphaproteobacteria bacterium]
MNKPYRLIGSIGSPYTMKLRAVLRYRRLPHVFTFRSPAIREQIADLRPQIIPILQLPEDGSFHVDTTPLIEMLEQRHAERSIVPPDPAQAFLAFLIEDMGDEWLTKAMFHYRWAYEADQGYAARWIVDDERSELEGEARAEAVRAIAERQIGRMALVGCTPQNAATIEATYRGILTALEPHVRLRRYLFGTRPSVAEFGLFGQLRTLATDPTPLAVIRAEAQRVESWLRQLDDASGIEGEWLDADADLPAAVIDLIRIAGAEYLPFLAANAAALETGADEVRLTIRGREWVQAPFGYQAKCLMTLRRRFADLDAGARARLDPLLRETGCLEVLAA